MSLYSVSINGEDWTEYEGVSAAHAASDACLTYMKNNGERREIDLLVVRKAERTQIPPVKAMVLDGESGWVGEVPPAGEEPALIPPPLLSEIPSDDRLRLAHAILPFIDKSGATDHQVRSLAWEGALQAADAVLALP